MAVEIGLLFELLDVVPIAAREDLPVDRREVVAGDVLPVFGELDAEALERTAVKAGEKPLDDRARLQLERPEARDNRRVEEPALARADVHYIPLLGTGTASSRRSTMWSDVIRSDSA